ncbi:autoinducer binding domain-containing protein [Variovorax sp. LjRoot175]|uniref:autoinducer binding domain-containing protein n=1 Tax=Variovorax sp. LjRoot175 TaxID=3342276 RepID=UPI003ECFBC67
MALWAHDVLRRLTGARSPEDAFAQIALGARELGFEYCAYGLRLPLSFTNPKTLILSSYERGWRERYLEAGYLRTDPTVAHGTRSAQPVVWSNKLFERAPQMWEEARSFGLRVGWAQSCFDADGRMGMLTLARSNERLTRKELLAHDPMMRWLANNAHLTLAGHLGGAQAAIHEPFTRRQVEVLRWTADGKPALTRFVAIRRRCARLDAIDGR